MSRLPIPATIDDAPVSSQPLLQSINKQLGSVPNLFRLVGISPAALEGYLGLNGALAKGALEPAMRERIALAIGQMGGGDVKLLGATAIVIAPAAAGSFLLAVSLSGGVLAMAYLAGRVLLPRPTVRRPTRLLPRVLRVEAWRIHHRGPLPYACAIAAGTIFVLS